MKLHEVTFHYALFIKRINEKDCNINAQMQFALFALTFLALLYIYTHIYALSIVLPFVCKSIKLAANTSMSITQCSQCTNDVPTLTTRS